MAGIKFIGDKNYVTLNYLANQLIKPEVKKHLFDDGYGWSEVAAVLFNARTVIYGIFSKGRPEPVGVVFFEGVIPYRNATLYACIFSAENRKKGLINDVIPKIKKDIVARFSIHSVVANIIGKNDASSHMLEKMGFKKIGTKKKFLIVGGKYQDLTEFYLELEKSK